MKTPSHLIQTFGQTVVVLSLLLAPGCNDRDPSNSSVRAEGLDTWSRLAGRAWISKSLSGAGSEGVTSISVDIAADMNFSLVATIEGGADVVITGWPVSSEGKSSIGVMFHSSRTPDEHEETWIVVHELPDGEIIVRSSDGGGWEATMVAAEQGDATDRPLAERMLPRGPIHDAVYERLGNPDELTGSGRSFLHYSFGNGQTLTLIISGNEIIGAEIPRLDAESPDNLDADVGK